MIKIVAALAAAGILTGCAAAGLTVIGAGAGVGMATGVDHTLTGTAYKTFTAPVNELRLATLQSLDRMDMKLSKDQADNGGWQLEATAADRRIEIELEKLTSATSRMRVVAHKGEWFLRDSATATEIVTQTAYALDDQRSRRPTLSSASTNGRNAR
jgi:hypothetical protein